MPKFDQLVENWTTAKPSAWAPWDNDAFKYVSGGQLRMGYTTSYEGIGTVAQNWDLTSSQVVFQVSTRPTIRGQQAGLSVRTTNDVGVGFTVEFDTLVLWISNGSQDQAIANSTAKFLRLREAAGTVYHESSPDGATWTTHRTTPTANVGGDLTACKVDMFTGSFNGNVGGLLGLGPFNATASGFSGTAAFSGNGQAARTSGAVAVSRAGAFTGSGDGPGAPSRVSMVGPSVAFSGAGTNGSTGTKSTVGSAPLTGAGTLSGTPRAGLRGTAPSTGAGLLAAYGNAAINVEATVALETVWLNPALDLTDGHVFPTLSGLKVTTEVVGESRRYTTGRLRTILRPGRVRSFELALKSLDRADVSWLEQHAGQLLCVRDDRGRKVYGTFLSVPVDEHSYNGEADVALSLVEVSHTEAV